MKKIVLGLVLASLCTGPALALDNPRASRYDHRIRSISYNTQDVVQLDTVIGVATHIMLEKGEHYVTHAFGDSEAYDFAVKENHVFIKPKAEQADTNLIIVTDRRTYNFRLTFQADRKDATYQVAFRYPDVEAAKAAKRRRMATIEAGFRGKHGRYNLDYTMSGDRDIAPVNAWDNGVHTFFKFPGNRDIPAIYMVGEDGKESIVNRTTRGESSNVVMVHKVNARWVLRLGDRALAVFNDSFDPVGIENTSGTSSPAVKRVVREGD